MNNFTDRSGPRTELSARVRPKGKTCGIPHLAKNERDVGHPATRGGIDESTLVAVQEGGILGVNDAQISGQT
jgi:hypothetical protein